jgi:hypothetical protein
VVVVTVVMLVMVVMLLDAGRPSAALPAFALSQHGFAYEGACEPDHERQHRQLSRYRSHVHQQVKAIRFYFAP